MKQNSLYIIAEAGVNHNGNSELAFQLVDVAVDAGADAVKFQTFKAENLVTKKAKKATYQMKTTAAEESQYEMLKKLELSKDLHTKLYNYCKSKKIEFLSTAFDFESLDFLKNELKLKKFKISSGEITNGPLLFEFSRTDGQLILSTGMATIGEIEDALAVIAYGLTGGVNPSITNFKKAYLSDKGQQALRQTVTLLHCTSEYPAPFDEINLRAINTLFEKFHLPVGYSDHTKGITVPIAAAALGACIIEKHFTLDKNLVGPDHSSSLNPDELKSMVSEIRNIEKALGNGIKSPTPSELRNKNVVRKSLIAKEMIKKKQQFTSDNITILRPGDGLSPMLYWEYLKKTASVDIKSGELIRV